MSKTRAALFVFGGLWVIGSIHPSPSPSSSPAAAAELPSPPTLQDVQKTGLPCHNLDELHPKVWSGSPDGIEAHDRPESMVYCDGGAQSLTEGTGAILVYQNDEWRCGNWKENEQCYELLHTGHVSPVTPGDPLEGKTSQVYDCHIEPGMGKEFPSAGKAHVVIDGATQQATVSLSGIVVDGETRPPSAATYRLIMHLDGTAKYPGVSIMWEEGMGINVVPDNELQLMTHIPGGWSRYAISHNDMSKAVPFWAGFSCHETAL